MILLTLTDPRSQKVEGASDEEDAVSVEKQGTSTAQPT
jgi:hypothetical protein